jgi:hypothetical protein
VNFGVNYHRQSRRLLESNSSVTSEWDTESDGQTEKERIYHSSHPPNPLFLCPISLWLTASPFKHTTTAIGRGQKEDHIGNGLLSGAESASCVDLGG